MGEEDTVTRFFRNIFFYLLVFILGLWIYDYYNASNAPKNDMSYSNFMKEVQQDDVQSVTIVDNSVIKGRLKNGSEFTTVAPRDDKMVDTLRSRDVEIKAELPPQPSFWSSILTSVLPMIVIVVLWFFMMNNAQGGGSRVMSFGKSKAKLYGDGKSRVLFRDVAGADEAKQELREVVEFLKAPQKYNQLGAKIPKGVLLYGPPGTGKTLLAKAVAGEAGVPFFSISGSDFVEMFVGVGASRVRDLFDQAKKNAPCIVFIDEIDAVGRQRGAGLGGGHDEREQTLNQLLVEMDGFGANEGIIMIAATNRPDILDPALLRPGRFDRQIVVDRPDIRGRLAILKVHAKGKPIDSNVDMEVLARRTPGFTGADLANLVNEGALLAARHNQMTITMSDLEEAAERVMMGPERRSRVISDNEKRLTAYHEGGHTLVGMLLDHTDPVHKVTIIPRGRAGGYTLSLPKEDRYYATRSELLDELKVLLGGRVAEALVLHEISSGASNDLQRATELARQMTCEYGMSERLGAVTFGHRQQQVFLGRDIGHENMYSEKIAAEIDGEIRRFIDEAYEGTVKLLQDNIDKLHLIAQALIERETLEEHEIKELVEYGRILEKGEVASSKEGSPMDPVKLEGETLPEGNPPSARQEGPLPKDDSQPLG
ncbi:ATP-dependent metalloprotease ftsH [Acidaminococcus intestini RyC-MR95]|uniref:ATP-dependent zinc metalloprotease FtsH n=2 Tax=Acidaminococcus intestini TaxID=187327 RepID=G4Q541_ACIIR|nr:ATP-dependent zinc metalloprotease FtsH [Acidaminococcus intestini]AEQ22023.1 ATP-dependent metalloprotease ftsH [Acidaminococcus intestini RyC-MR95]